MGATLSDFVAERFDLPHAHFEHQLFALGRFLGEIASAALAIKQHVAVVFTHELGRGLHLDVEALDEGRFGQLIMGTIRVRWCRDQSYYDQDAWRGTWAMDGGGAFSNQGIHEIDRMISVLGMPDEVRAKELATCFDGVRSGADALELIAAGATFRKTRPRVSRMQPTMSA